MAKVDLDGPLEDIYKFPRLYVPTPNGKTNGERNFEPFVLQPSLFENVPPTIYFRAKENCDSRPPVALPKRMKKYFKWKFSTITPNSIRNCIQFMSFEIIKASNTTCDDWLGAWCKHMLTADFAKIHEWQKINHYPGSFHMGRKDKLSSRLNLFMCRHGVQRFGHFHPMTFVLPRDHQALVQYSQMHPDKMFIMKPPASARGNGITVIESISQIPETALEPIFVDGMVTTKSTLIVQDYISSPCLLANGRKFDLRIYILVTSIDPLRMYLFEDGLVRFASVQYNTPSQNGDLNTNNTLDDRYMHLTNYSVNKESAQYEINEDSDSLNGCKWTLKTFWRHLRENYADKVDVDQLWNNVIDIVRKTVISCEGPMFRLSSKHCKNDYTCYELFGIDIILDNNFKPWILEVNITPSLRSESGLDTSVKSCVIRDMFNIVGYHLPPHAHDAVQASLKNSQNGEFVCFDKRLYTPNLTHEDKIKHGRYTKLARAYQQHIQKQHQNQDQAIAQGLQSRQNNSSDQERYMNGVINTRNGFSGGAFPDTAMNANRTTELNGTINSLDLDITTDDPNQSDSLAENYINLLASIVDELTPNDARVLMQAENEFSRRGQFIRVYPPNSKVFDYLYLFERPRYYNLLLAGWEYKYRNNRHEGIVRLQHLANECFHLRTHVEPAEREKAVSMSFNMSLP